METQTVRLLGEGMETHTVKGTGGARAWRHRR